MLSNTIIIILVIVFAIVFFTLYFNKYEVKPDNIIKLLNSNDIKVININNENELKNKRDWDIVINDKTYFNDIINSGTIGIGESYMDGKWDCDSLDVLYDKIIFNKLDKNFQFENIADKIKIIISYLFNQQSKGDKSYEVEDVHYNIGNDLYENMLGNTMAYSCGYWTLTNNLDQAQINKFELICKKLQLKQDDNVLDIGSGFGGLAKYMADNYGCKVTGVNISTEQLKYARKLCEKHILDGKIKFIDCDYRDVPEDEKYDKIVSVGFCEHVGYKNYRIFCQKAYNCLKDGGLFLLHTIGGNVSTTCTDPWIDKYIFPNGLLPSVSQLSSAVEDLFVIEDLHNFGPYYDKTLMAWYKNYEDAIKNGKIKNNKKFYRMWRYYLLTCAACFRARSTQLWQIILSKGNRNLYECVR
ncbi:MAG: cyclopropane-fatty-acyl-phospholipid synthase [Edafosvirus sp.]|uniref:Cyclopropane-fatty-acyl-phospholipid synthase n=1 Tax=Edafosvirus sp. TaxID=2487765 RepID=A0A3G4ZTK0_9VIRU|nr:MAG: cyclopropane-fatty-acyl-phospholipid synthase [Edafosvirus sp.]